MEQEPKSIMYGNSNNFISNLGFSYDDYVFLHIIITIKSSHDRFCQSKLQPLTPTHFTFGFFCEDGGGGFGSSINVHDIPRCSQQSATIMVDLSLPWDKKEIMTLSVRLIDKAKWGSR